MDEKKSKLSLDDELTDYVSLSKYLKEDNERKKKLIYNEIEELGNIYINEIEKKRNRKKIIQKKLIPFILKYQGDIYNEKELLSYSFEDVQDIYNKIKKEKKSPIIKFIQFIFNLE